MTGFRPGFADEVLPGAVAPGSAIPMPATASASLDDAVAPQPSPVEARARSGAHAPGFVETISRPDVAEQIAVKSQRRRVTQGVLIEEAWLLYQKHKSSN